MTARLHPRVRWHEPPPRSTCRRRLATSSPGRRSCGHLVHLPICRNAGQSNDVAVRRRSVAAHLLGREPSSLVVWMACSTTCVVHCFCRCILVQRHSYARWSRYPLCGNGHPSCCDVSVNQLGIIQEFYVVPTARSAGVGGALLQAARAHARSKGWKRLELCTPPLPDFQRTLAFYERNGFEVTGGRKMKALL